MAMNTGEAALFKPFQKILIVAFDGNTTRSLLRRILPMAESHKASLTVLSPIELPDDLPELENTSVSLSEMTSALTKHRAQELDQAVRDRCPRGQKAAVKVVTGRALQEIIRETREGEYDLVVKMAEGKGDIGALFFGTLDFKLLRKSPCPVLIMKPSRKHSFGRILTAVQLDDDDLGDFSDQTGGSFQFNADILDAAIAMAHAENAELHILNAWSYFAEEFLRTKRGFAKTIDQILAEVKSSHRTALEQLIKSRNLDGLQHRLHLLKGDAETVISKAAQNIDADLIVMGTVGRIGIPGFFIGNTAETVLNNTRCSVLALKPRGFISPVS